MKAVSNTTPLRYLIAIGHDYLLERLFEKISVPAAVRDELTDARSPDKVRHYFLSLPAWYEVRTVREVKLDTFPVSLHRGEREAIVLAETLRPDVLLIDDQAGRTIALGRSIPISETLGVIERADTLGLVEDFPSLLAQLRTSGFFISETLEQLLLSRHRLRRRA